MNVHFVMGAASVLYREQAKQHDDLVDATRYALQVQEPRWWEGVLCWVLYQVIEWMPWLALWAVAATFVLVACKVLSHGLIP